jgi:hypothetical protein
MYAVSAIVVSLLISITLLSRKHRWKAEGCEDKQMDFEFGDTEKSRAFLSRSPQFPAALEKVMIAANKCLARAEPPSEKLVEHICFWLGHTCRHDFIEILFIAINGYGGGATKLLRSLYERAVTIDYIIQNPEKVGRFTRFAALQEHRAIEAALRTGLTEVQIDAEASAGNTVAEIRTRFEQHKAEFKASECKVCGVKTPASWDVDFSSMVRKVGDPYNKLFLLCNNGPNFLIHATLASASQRDDAREEADAQAAIMVATELFLSVLSSLNTLLGLKLDADIDSCITELRAAQEREVLRGTKAE